MAFLFASEASALATDRSLHAHGGYGYAEEYDIQLYFRRARGWSLIAGDPARECLHLADALFGPVSA
jgi:alkylation response protein AidB-like acyl-CoA dehydrogenase